VTVKLVSQSVLDEHGLEMDAWFDYSDKGAEILILKDLSLVQQRACLAHELQHAVIDYLDVLVNAGVAELSYRKKGG
jgi:Zn-dependent peptidase ImmA (M78 family)